MKYIFCYFINEEKMCIRITKRRTLIARMQKRKLLVIQFENI